MITNVFVISHGFAPLFRTYFFFSKLLEFKEFSKTLIPFALVGYETGYSQLGSIDRFHCHAIKK